MSATARTAALAGHVVSPRLDGVAGPLLAEAIRRLTEGRSIDELLAKT